MPAVKPILSFEKAVEYVTSSSCLKKATVISKEEYSSDMCDLFQFEKADEVRHTDYNLQAFHSMGEVYFFC